MKYPSTRAPERNTPRPKDPSTQSGKPRRIRVFGIRCLGAWVILSGAWVFGSWGICSAASAAAPIPETGISALQQELRQGASASIPSESRRIYKGVIREAQALLTASPDAPNRFAVLGVIFDGQKRLLSIEDREENRAAVFATARELQQAPDAFAELRLGADLLLMEKSMGEQEAKVAERSQALVALLASYRGTPAEWKSLMIGSMIATKLLDYGVVDSIEARMLERFAGDHNAIQYRRAKEAIKPLDVVLSGTYKAASGGASVSLPLDRWGHQYIAYFWSETTPRIDDYLLEAKELQKAHPGRFEVISFNVDELPDAGQKKLHGMGLDWVALHLPGGRENPAYRAYARVDPCAVFVNAQGHALLEATPKRLGITAVEGMREEVRGQKLSDLTWVLDDARYLAQLRYLFGGDFLVAGLPASSSIPTDIIQPIQACFAQVPFRYRLSRDEELANYRNAAALCASALDKHADSKDGWILRNRKIIALIGMWNLSGEATHLDAAVTEAEAVLGMAPPAGADVVARFCRVKAALRRGDDPEILLTDFIATCGGDDAPPSALAAATTLALEANARSVHQRYRARFLALGEGIDVSLSPVRAFLLDRLHRFRNFWASPGGFHFDDQLSKYGYRQAVSGLLDPPPGNIRVSIEMKKLDGGRLTIPKDMPERALGVIFVEPSGDADVQSRAMGRAKDFAGNCRQHGADAVVALLTDDIDTAKAMAQGNHDFQIAMVPGGLTNPLVRKLGILSADRLPNLLLLRPDGTLAWMISGLDYRYVDKGGGPDLPIKYGIVNNIDKLKTDAGFEALERGEYKTAMERWDGFKPHNPKGDWWISDRRHGKALAYMGLKDWNAALEAVEGAIDARRWVFRSGLCACHGIVEMLLTKATILDRLGRGDEAETARDEASQEVLPHADFPPGEAFRVGVPVGVYYDWLKRIRLGMDGVGEPRGQQSANGNNGD